jgi:hypothetical protein
MKKFLAIALIAASFVACNEGEKKVEEAVSTAVDSAAASTTQVLDSAAASATQVIDSAKSAGAAVIDSLKK